jgi:alpha-ribazole phosphatase
MSASMEIYLVRHPRPSQSEGLCYGRTEMPLDPDALAAPREPGVIAELHEMHFGSWEGTPWKSVPRLELDAWASEVWTYRAGGGESAAGLIRIALAGASRLGSELSLDVPFGSVHRVDIDTVELGGIDIDASQACTP